MAGQMKTASIRDFAEGSARVLAWLQAGETVAVLQDDGRPLGKFVPAPDTGTELQERFARRFAPLDRVPDRDLSDIVTENRSPI